jgi:hypothetical protein
LLPAGRETIKGSFPKLHDKTAALEKLARALGMFKENVVLDGKLHGANHRRDRSAASSKAVGGKRDKGH